MFHLIRWGNTLRQTRWGRPTCLPVLFENVGEDLRVCPWRLLVSVLGRHAGLPLPICTNWADTQVCPNEVCPNEVCPNEVCPNEVCPYRSPISFKYSSNGKAFAIFLL
jgi:hypothetical protein